MYLKYSHPRRDFPIPAMPMTETRCARFSSAGRVEELLHQAELAIASDEWRLESRRLQRTAASGRHPERSPERDLFGLALEVVLSSGRVCDGGLRGSLRRLADQDGARLGRRLDPRRRVDEVAGDHALPFRPERDGGFSGQDTGSRLERRVELGYRREQIERGPNRPLRVVLGRDGRSPDGHDGVPDELLDGAAVALDDAACGVEVAREELAGLLGVATLGGCREADEVGEEDGDEAALRRRR